MKTLELNGKQYNICESVDEMTYWQLNKWVELTRQYSETNIEKENMLSMLLAMFAVITDIEDDALMNMKQKDISFEQISEYIKVVAESFTAASISGDVLDSINIIDESIKVPKDLGFLTWGQKIEAERVIRKMAKDNEYGMRIELLKIYLKQEAFEKNIDIDSIDFDKLNGVAVYNISNFFLKNWNG